MQLFEYKAIPAPRRGEKQRGLKTTEDRFAYALSQRLNEMAAEGWDYLRAELLPVDERSGFTGVKTSEHHLLIFRRARPTFEASASAPVARLGAAQKEAPTNTAPSLGPATTEES